MPESKPRRSIFDTLKKSAEGRLGLADAARVADKISVFPPRRTEVGGGRLAEAQSLAESGHDPTPVGTAVPTGVPTPVGTAVPTGDPTAEPTNDPTLKHDPTAEPTNDPTLKNLLRGLSPNKRRFLHFIIDNEPRQDDYIISRQEVVNKLNLTEISVKRYFAEFASLGFFRKETYRRGVCQGVRLFLVRSLCQRFKAIDPTHDPTHVPTPTNAPTPDPIDDPTTSNTIDRKNSFLSISSENLETNWPQLAASGFGPSQLEQISANLTTLGKPLDRIVQGLDHAEWELEHDLMCDKDGHRVSDPCAWVFRSLARTGYYRRPKGYVSPEEQAALDAQAEAKAVIEARQRAEAMQFEAWRAELTPEELAEAMVGCPGGPREQWLKRYWKIRVRKDGEDG